VKVADSSQAFGFMSLFYSLSAHGHII